MKTPKFLKSIGDYFNLQSTAPDESNYNFVVKGKNTLQNGVLSYFDLYAPYHQAKQAAVDIMALANAEGITKGRSIPSEQYVYGFSYEEASFKLKVKLNGRLLLDCDAAFAEKVKTLASVASVKEINKDNTKPSAPKTDKPQL